MAFINLAFQLSLLVTLLTAAYLARRKKKFRYHCTIMRVAVPLQIVVITIIMFPDLLGYMERGQRGPLFESEILFHHLIGLMVIALFVIINLSFSGIIRIPIRLRVLMRTAFVS